MGFNIAITSKYKPFTYEDYIKPLKSYWEDYDKAEEELGTIQNDVAKIKAIIETAPEDDPVRIQALDLYNQLQQEADALANEGYTARGKKAIRNLKNTYNSLIPRIVTAEEALRKDRNRYAELRNSGQYIMANDSNNPSTYTWRDYIDGQIPDYTIGIEKSKAYNAGKSASALISSRVVGEPTFTPKNGFTAITTELGLQYNNAAEMMENPDIASAVEDIVTNYTQGPGWTEAAKDAVRQEVIRGAYEGLVYKTNTQYQRGVSNDGFDSSDFTRMPTQDGNIAIIDNKSGRVVRTETPDGSLVNSTPKSEESNYIEQYLGKGAIPIGDVYRSGRVAKKKNYDTADGKLDLTGLLANFENTEKNKRQTVRLATASETDNALQNLINDILKNNNISSFTTVSDITSYINDNYIVMIEGGKGIGSQDNHVYAVPTKEAAKMMAENTNYTAAKAKLKQFRDRYDKDSNAHEIFDNAYRQVNVLAYASQLSGLLRNNKDNNNITLQNILDDENLTTLGLNENEIKLAILQLKLDRDQTAYNIYKELLKKEQESSDQKENNNTQSSTGNPEALPKTMG